VHVIGNVLEVVPRGPCRRTSRDSRRVIPRGASQGHRVLRLDMRRKSVLANRWQHFAYDPRRVEVSTVGVGGTRMLTTIRSDTSSRTRSSWAPAPPT
jgi:hypothetical protein